jgi:hypothetical protein
MRSILWILLAAAVTLALPAELWSQGQGRGRGRGHDRRDADVRIERRGRDADRDRDDDRIRGRAVVRIDDLDDLDDLDDDEVLLLRSRGRTVVVGRGDIERRFPTARERGRGPAFCRSGEGHPVWGREWCLEKGFGLGARRVVIDRDRVSFPLGNDVVIARVVEIDDDRGWVGRIVDRILFWTD